MRVTSVICVATAILAICGCTPEETFVAVNATALKKAVAGELASAKVEMVFDISNKEDPELPNKIRKVALPYLGKDAVIELEKTEKRKVRAGGSIRDSDEEVEVDKSLEGVKLVARFSIPVGMESVLASAPRSIMWLKYTPDDRTFRLVNGNAIGGLNSALSGVNEDIKYEYDGGYHLGFDEALGTTIKIVNDDNVTVGIAAATVNGKKIIASVFSTGDHSLKIAYNNEFYEGLSPCFVYGTFQAVNAVSLKKKSSWDWDD
jgi:hypothetical protein